MYVYINPKRNVTCGQFCRSAEVKRRNGSTVELAEATSKGNLDKNEREAFHHRNILLAELTEQGEQGHSLKYLF